MALGLYEKSMPGHLTWREKLTAAKEAGYDYVEISIDETDAKQARLDWTAAEFADFVQAQLETGVPVRSMCLSGHRKYPFGSHDPALRARSREIMEKAILFAEKAGVRLIQLAGYDVYYEEGDEQTRAWFEEGLRHAVQFAAEHEVLLGFETMETPFMDTVEKGMAWVEKIDSPYLGMYPDIGNMTNAAELYAADWKEDLRRANNSLMAVHLKETVPGKYRDMMFGDGRVEFETTITIAREMGVGSFTAEFWHDGSENWMERLKFAAEYLKKWM